MKRNSDKYHLNVSTHESIEIQIWESLRKSSTFGKLLKVKIDHKLNFNTYAKGLCKSAYTLKSSRKSDAIKKEKKKKKKPLMNSFLKAQHIYCPLIEMLHSRSNNNKIKHLQERSIGTVYEKQVILWRAFVKEWFSLCTP